MNLFDRILCEKERLEQLIAADEEKIANLPEGNLIIAKRSYGFEWYVKSCDGSRKFLPKSEVATAQALALKRCIKADLIAKNNDLRAVEAYLKMYSKKTSDKNACVEDLLDENPEIKRLLVGQITFADKQVNDWLNDVYSGSRPYPEKLTVNTKAGIKVRSKSEQIIVGHLFDSGIPFKYEDRLKVRNYDIFPDFKIMNPRTHQIFVWEHFGRMDDERYRHNNIPKINEYAEAGYLLGDNLILTFETAKSGIDEAIIDFYIDHYLT